MKQFKRSIITILFLALIFSLSFISFAHSGRTDSRGGHRDNQNRSGLGSYHFHCGGHPAHLHKNGVCPYDPKDTITLGNYNSIMFIGDSQEITYSIKSVSYISGKISSSDTNIISVKGNCLTAKSAGKATITITSYNNTKQFTITVKAIEVEDIILSDDSLNLQVGSEKRVNVAIIPSNATDQSIIWSSSDENIATIRNGKILAIGDGTVTITATSSNGINKEIIVEVYTIFPESIEISSDSLNIEIIDNDSIDVKILPDNSNDKTYTVNIKNNNIIDISIESDTIYITPINEGSTEILIKTWNGIEKVIPVEIYSIPVEEIIIDDSTVTYLRDKYIDIKEQNIQLNYTLLPENCTYKEIVWNTSNDSIIIVSSDNTFSIIGTGEVTLTCFSPQNNISNNISFIVIDKDKIIMMIIAGTGLVIILFIAITSFVFKKIKSRHQGIVVITRL